MGAIQGILLAQYETLRENGHNSSEAFNETVEELTQSLMPLFAKNGMDWMYVNCSTTAQRGASTDGSVPRCNKACIEKIVSRSKVGTRLNVLLTPNSQPDYREKLNEELRRHEMCGWCRVRKLRPENN